MATLAKRQSLLPKWTGELLDPDRFFGPRLFDFNGDGFDLAERIPSVNITENEKEFNLEMAAPGLERKDFKVEVDKGTLNISSEKETESTDERKNFTRREYSYSSFHRAFVLPENSMPEKIEAQYKNGILHITLPKKEVTISHPVR
ncbi:MAG: Hsp20/alpha crystallin family protein, partial [Bacteroidota bacterium]